jgi:hypothetical protein
MFSSKIAVPPGGGGLVEIMFEINNIRTVYVINSSLSYAAGRPSI